MLSKGISKGDAVQCLADVSMVSILERVGTVESIEDAAVTVLIDGFRWLLSIHELRRCDEEYRKRDRRDSRDSDNAEAS